MQEKEKSMSLIVHILARDSPIIDEDVLFHRWEWDLETLETLRIIMSSKISRFHLGLYTNYCLVG